MEAYQGDLSTGRIVMGFDVQQGSPVPTLFYMMARGQQVMALYTLRYVQDFGYNFESAHELAWRAVWGDTPEERAENTPGPAIVEQTFFVQRRLGMIPPGATWDR